jgi:hypothetical protein
MSNSGPQQSEPVYGIRIERDVKVPMCDGAFSLALPALHDAVAVVDGGGDACEPPGGHTKIGGGGAGALAPAMGVMPAHSPRDLKLTWKMDAAGEFRIVHISDVS